jgi:hypothetical protein
MGKNWISILKNSVPPTDGGKPQITARAWNIPDRVRTGAVDTALAAKRGNPHSCCHHAEPHLGQAVIWYSVIAQGGTPPVNTGELRESFYTKRKKDVIEFDFDDSGKTAHLAVQIENEGPWGPLVQALIP